VYEIILKATHDNNRGFPTVIEQTYNVPIEFFMGIKDLIDDIKDLDKNLDKLVNTKTIVKEIIVKRDIPLSEIRQKLPILLENAELIIEELDDPVRITTLLKVLTSHNVDQLKIMSIIDHFCEKMK